MHIDNQYNWWKPALWENETVDNSLTMAAEQLYTQAGGPWQSREAAEAVR